jgi:hypothetical protein
LSQFRPQHKKAGEASASSTFNLVVETPPPPKQLNAVYTKDFEVNSSLWSARTKALSPTAFLSTEWKPELLGGVVVIKGQLTDGSPMMAIPNFARANRDPATKTDGSTTSRPATSIVWIAEG